MNASIATWQLWLVDFYLLATVLLAAALVVASCIRQPVYRVSLAWAVILALVGLAVVAGLPGWPRVHLVPDASVAQIPSERPLPAAKADPRSETGWPWSELVPPPPEALSGSIGLPLAAPPRVGGSLSPIPWTRSDALRWLLTVFLAGSAVTGLWLALGAIEVAWLCRRAVPAPGDLRAVLEDIVGEGNRAPRLVLSRKVGNAVALGTFWPTILWPASPAGTAGPDGLRAVLAHEWAHIRNRDLWLLAAVRGLLVLLYAHPLYWCLRHIIRRDQEILADAVAAGGRGLEYAMDLVKWTRQLAVLYPLPVAAALKVWQEPSELSRRIGMLIDEEGSVQTEPPRRWRSAVLAAVALAALGLSLVTLRPGQATETDPRSPAEASETTDMVN
jgi:beta-lactamase regulating signal transducer with metallopeptidase domain